MIKKKRQTHTGLKKKTQKRQHKRSNNVKIFGQEYIDPPAVALIQRYVHQQAYTRENQKCKGIFLNCTVTITDRS